MMKIGLFTFGGGYAMMALLENEFISKRGWINKDEFVDMVAISESTPGPIAINAATFIGYKLFGILGAVISTIGVCIPSFVIIYCISLFLDTFLTFTVVYNAFRGIKIAVVYLIASAGVKLFKGMKKKPFAVCIFTVCMVLSVVFSICAVNFSSIVFILISGILGIGSYFISRRKKQ